MEFGGEILRNNQNRISGTLNSSHVVENDESKTIFMQKRWY